MLEKLPKMQICKIKNLMGSLYKKGWFSVSSKGNRGELSGMNIYAIGNICAKFQLVPIYFPFKPIFEGKFNGLTTSAAPFRMIEGNLFRS